MSYTTFRTACFLYFFDIFNQDPRRYARPEWLQYPAFFGGMAAGILSNPFEIVFSRMQADPLYTVGRGYKSFYDGFLKTAEEGALFKGSIANGLRITALLASMTNIHDWMKENSYYWLGPSILNRLGATIVATAVGTAVSMPFDNIRMRVYLSRPLPNGYVPYLNSLDATLKMIRFEARQSNNGNFQCFLSGYCTAFARYFSIFMISQFVLD